MARHWYVIPYTDSPMQKIAENLMRPWALVLSKPSAYVLYILFFQGNLPEIMLPQLPEPFKPSRQQRTSSFDVLFLDSDLRITRGSRGELRIFVKT